MITNASGEDRQSNEGEIFLVIILMSMYYSRGTQDQMLGEKE